MNHSARYAATVAFLVSLTWHKTSFEKDCTLAIEFVILNFFLHSLFTVFSFSEVFSDIQKECFGNFKEGNKVSWWIHTFVESTCGKTGLLYHLNMIWLKRMGNSFATCNPEKIKDSLCLALALIYLLKLIVESQVKTLILQCSSEKNPKFHCHWRLRRQPAVTVPGGLCSQSCYALQWEFCLSTKRWTGAQNRSRGRVAASPENEACKGQKILWGFFFSFPPLPVMGYRYFRFKVDTLKLEGELYSH